MMQEEWLPVVGLETRYEVSNLGRVRSIKKVKCRGMAIRNRVLSLKIAKSGYPCACVYLGPGIKKTLLVHRLVLEAFCGPPLSGQVCRHKDGSRNNNLINNLEWGTQAENYEDSRRHGTYTHGERSGQAVLTEKLVLQIRALLSAGQSATAIANTFGVNPTTVCHVRDRRTWRHIP